MPAGFGKLASHMDVGWDLDGTLIGHPASTLLHQFIRATPRIRHVIVTFRNRKLHGDPWADLAAYHGAPPREAFDGAVFVQDEAMEDFSRSHQATRAFWPLSRFMRRPTDGACRRWKGQVCSRNGLTALVDDMTSMVASGCRQYGVELFHPKDFLPPS